MTITIRSNTDILPAETSSRQRWLYSIANLGNSIPYQAVGAVLLFFYTDVKHMPAGWAAIAMSIYGIYNALNNPLLGYLQDRTRSRWGRRLPYILFSTLPYALAFILLWTPPFDGRQNPVGLLFYFIFFLFLWEGLGTAVSTAYYSLFPEMYTSYQERTDVAVRMNAVEVVGMIIGAALAPVLSEAIGYFPMSVLFALMAGGAMYLGLPAMFERRSYQEEKPIPLSVALKATFVNRSFVAVVVAQTLRFFATNTLTIGMMFYMKYSVKTDPGLTTIILGVVFISAGAFLWPWRRFVARHLSTRTTTMLAYAATGLAVIPLGFAHSTAMAIVGGVFIGFGLAGLNLVGDVIMADVVDEDDVKTGQRRAGMFFGLSSLWTILSSSLVALIFGWVTRTYGYDTVLAVQPASVDLGFRVFMTIPPAIGCMLAIVALWFYPLHGERLAAVRTALAARSAEK